MIQFEHVNKSYGKNPVLKDLNFTIQDGQFVVLIGPSGCGKTTTMKMINRLLEPDSGTISIDGQDIHKQDKVELRRHIGYVIQQIGLFPNMTAVSYTHLRQDPGLHPGAPGHGHPHRHL